MKVIPLSLSVLSSGEKMNLMLFSGDTGIGGCEGIEDIGRGIIRRRKEKGNDQDTIHKIEKEIRNLILFRRLDWPKKLPKPR